MRWAIFSALLFLAAAITPYPALADPASPPDAPFFDKQVAVYATPDQLPGHNVIKFLPNAGISVIEVASGREWGQVQRLRERGFKAGLNLKAAAFVVPVVPNDPLLHYQWQLPSIQAEEAWQFTAQDPNGGAGAGVTVAVLDTGLATGGPDGISCVKMPHDTLDGDSDPQDGNGHGTHVSGTIAQTTNNGQGVAGVAYGACIMPVKVLDDNGSGSFADIADGISYAVKNGAKVINMSLGTNSRYALKSDPIMDPQLAYAEQEKVTVVCAAGNEGNRKNVSYPAIYPSAIAVGATGWGDKVTRYSNSGLGLDLVAPGGDRTQDGNRDGSPDGILQETFSKNAWGYYFFQGTSMASPHVAAAAALLISHGTATLPAEVRNALFATCKDLGAPGYDSASGWGLVQLYNALVYPGATQTPVCTDNDGDGYAVEDGACGPVDCDDHDPNTYPGHSDKGRWGHDGVDNDCNVTIDG